MSNTMSTTGSVGLRFSGDGMGIEMGVISDQEILAAYSGLPASEAREQFAKDYDKRWKPIVERRKKIQDEREGKATMGTEALKSTTPTVSVVSVPLVEEAPPQETVNKISSNDIQLFLRICINNGIDIINANECSISILMNGKKFRIIGD